MCMKKREEVVPTFTEEEKTVVQRLKETPGLYQQYTQLDADWKQRFMDYCMGKKTLPLTYDPFFKCSFHPDVHSDRLSRFLSSILDEKVKVIQILPQEDSLMAGTALLIMDILVELENGALCNVEVQKSPYLFPGERMSCYSSDLVMRQYSRVKGEKGKNFKYSDIKSVYTIVIYEKSLKPFHEVPGKYIHKGKTVFDTGLKVELLQKYWLIALDVFKEISYAVDRNEQAAWLSLLATEDVEEAEKLAEEFPWLEEIYREMEEYVQRPQEVMNMFSEALRILDQNTVQYMVEQQQLQIDEQTDRLREQGKQLEEQEEQLEQQGKQLEEQEEQLEQQGKQLEEQEEQIANFNRGLVTRVRKKYERGKTASEASEELEEEVLTVQSIYNLIAESPEESDEEIVLRYMNKEADLRKA